MLGWGLAFGFDSLFSKSFFINSTGVTLYLDSLLALFFENKVMII